MTVYFIGDGGKAIKLCSCGRSVNFDTRLSQLQSGNSKTLKVLEKAESQNGDTALLNALRKKLEGHHIQRDWYTDNHEVRVVMQDACRGKLKALPVRSRETWTPVEIDCATPGCHNSLIAKKPDHKYCTSCAIKRADDEDYKRRRRRKR